MLSFHSTTIPRRQRLLALLALSTSMATLAACGDAFTLILQPAGASATSSSAASSGGGVADSTSAAQGSGGATAGATGTTGAGGSPLTHAILVVDAAKKPVGQIPIVVNDESGALVFTTASDDLGQATVEIPEGGSVSALSSAGAHFEVMSFFDPPPNAPITLGVVEPAPPPSPPAPIAATTFNVALILPQGATSWSCRNACTANSGTFEDTGCTITNGACSTKPTQDILALAYNGSTLLGWAAALAIPTKPEGTVDLALAVTQPVAAIGVQVTGIPGDFASAGASISAAASDTVRFPFEQFGYAPNSSLALGFIVPAGLAGGYDINESAGTLKATSIVGVERRRHYATVPTLASFAADAPARIYIHPLDRSDPTRPELTWSAAAGLRCDYGTVVLGWTEGGVTFDFKAYFPPDSNGHIRLPEVRGSFAPTEASEFTQSSIAYEDVETIDGYAAALTAVVGGAPLQDGLGIVRSYGFNLSAL